MFEKYPLIDSRYEELSEAIVQPDIIADTARYQAYLKERAALEEQVTAWQSYQSLLRHREQAQEMLSDPDLHEMAEEELQSLAAQIAEAEQQLRILLLPRDPDDDHSIIMEIRGGADGLDFYRQIARSAPHFLRPGGVLLLEVGFDQAEAVMALLADFADVQAHEDYQHIPRMIEARKHV